ncbi:MAG: hypothetical protein N3D20_03295, partial [Candidatus Pacearchaeota archaeon]|nr:hypothetical protein [Candidatus Pacearchaeota archaeon]
MAEIVLNRFKVEIVKPADKIYFYLEDVLGVEKYYLARYKPTRIEQDWKFLNDELKKWIKDYKNAEIKCEPYIYISFLEPENYITKQDVNFQDLSFSLKKKYLKEVLISTLKKDYIIEPVREGADFSIYYPKNGKDQYIRFDVVFNVYTDSNKKINYEVIIGVGSTDSYIIEDTSKKDLIRNQSNNFSSVKCVNEKLLIRPSSDNVVFKWPIKANFEIRQILGIGITPKRKFYKEYYDLINKFIKELSGKLEKFLIFNTSFNIIKETKLVS